jgi:hypothetical protein
MPTGPAQPYAPHYFLGLDRIKSNECNVALEALLRAAPEVRNSRYASSLKGAQEQAAKCSAR